jgi:hypothetical protein
MGNIMTAKEKAKELVNKFFFDTTLNEFEDCKDCALVAVDEMISMLPFTDLTTYMGKWCEQQRNYLNEVKQEIENL